MRRLLFALLCTSLIAIIGCGDGGDGDDRAETLNVTTVATAAASSRSPVAASPSPTPRPNQIDLTRALLSLEDMPTGFTTVPPDDEDDRGSQPCGKSTELRHNAVETKEAEFTKGAFGPIISHVASTFKSGEAKDRFDQARTIFEGCPSWTETDEKGETVEYRLSPLSFPRLGDQAYAMRMDVKTGGAVAQADIVFVRRGDVIFLLGNTVGGLGVAMVDSALTEQLARKAVEKLQAAQ